ncbi:polysaccharide biosynthesis protein [Actinomyces lilanjuaniae]|uniref:Polysaccharide biosynthesis protein n=1 Tax=Actinomyces lilanjuaniae TaxID=2321394 RepID=A0ABM6Z567_9ACTO|nr:nucleoside-diphosphate sugar epimerase/dehydratase [Actinomyces lilanjuaniae]AYD90103.1 polysaccharide biosynthesis protein [Actinomyces lilanjuaniae]
MRISNRQAVIAPTTDTLGWIVSGLMVHGLNTTPAALPTVAIIVFLLTAAATNLLLGRLVLLTYRRRFRTASFEEATALACQYAVATLAGALAVTMWSAATNQTVSVLAIVAIPWASLAIALLARFTVRVSRTYARAQAYQRAAHNRDRVIILGAGEVGGQIVRLTKNDAASPFVPVGLVDDDTTKKYLRLHGVPVLGTIDSLVSCCQQKDVRTVIIAIADLPTERLKQVTQECARNGIKTMTIVPVREIARRRIQFSDIKDIDLTDVLGRREVHIDLSRISDYVAGRSVLVTGAGGSIGSEIARQLHRIGPRDLVLLDRDESALHTIQLDIYNKGLLDTRDIVLCDIRDKEALRQVFQEHRPEVVFHAAALKHLPLLEQYPDEGWKTNVLGTKNVLELSEETAVTTLVNISTDKAADPTSVLGRTKHVAEQMTTSIALENGLRFVSVRFGNVLGSRGSMLWTFKHQIDSGGPVTVTDPRVERYFMTIPEACQLVLHAGAIGRPGDTMVLDMGEPVRILDVAQRLIAQSGNDVEVEFTGLRPGEKLSEDLIATDEDGIRPFHPLISHVRVEPVAPHRLDTVREWAYGAAADARHVEKDAKDITAAQQEEQAQPVAMSHEAVSH